jgi:arylsulfatase A-like enzyme
VDAGISRQALKLRALVLAIAASLAASASVRTQTPALPNVVLILTDDLGYGDLGSYGVKDAKTPNLDRLAREGVRFTDFYANAANCSPTRTALITGRYQQRVGIEMPLGTYEGDRNRGLMPTETSLPRLLKSAGYATGLFGKWHLGWKPEFQPNRHGFDQFWGFLSGSHDYYADAGDLYENDRPARQTGYLTDEITARATDFISKNARGPFFVEVAYNAVHWPFQPPDLPAGKRARPDVLHDGTRADYVAMLERADRGIGQILTTIDRLGLTTRTLVIFTNDNGGEWLSRNAPFFNRKSTLWEGGLRVPAIFRWPGHLAAGAASRQVGITMDLYATIVSLAGVKPPASSRPEGLDLVPLLMERRLVERTLFWRIQNAARDQKAVRRGRWKYMRDGAGTVDGVHEFLFDLERDPGERQDESVTHVPMLVEFRRLLAAWEADVGKPAPR